MQTNNAPGLSQLRKESWSERAISIIIINVMLACLTKNIYLCLSIQNGTLAMGKLSAQEIK